MYWNKVAGFYDLFENLTNKKVYSSLGNETAQYISKEDKVLECACGTGVITKVLAQKCRCIVATDFSEKMLKQAIRRCRTLNNIKFEKADIMKLEYDDESFDKVVAANVIHLLDDPKKAIDQLYRVCKNGGKIIIPTYIDETKDKENMMVKILQKSGAGFKVRFNYDSYQQFFEQYGYKNVEYKLLKGKMSCAFAVITKEKTDNIIKKEQ